MDPRALARSLAIEIKHMATHRPLSFEEQEAIREAAAQIVELLAEEESKAKVKKSRRHNNRQHQQTSEPGRKYERR